MLTDADKARQASDAIRAADELERELLIMAGGEIAELDDFGRYTVARRLGRVSVDASRIVQKHTQRIFNAARRDLRRDFVTNAQREAEIAKRAGEPMSVALVTNTAYSASDEAFRKMSPVIEALLRNVTRGTMNAYVYACERAAIQVDRVGTREAMKNAVGFLANKGISSYSYTRKDGVEVHVPVDVGVKRAIVNAGQRGRLAQTLQIAQITEHDLVEVNTTANARPSHAEWQGEIYSLSGASTKYKPFNSSCNVGDPVNGIGGYNCGHEVALYYPGYSRTFTDPLAGTGYTTEEVRELTNRQRALEREVRAAKREANVLKSCGFNPAEANAKARDAQAKIRALVSANDKVLWRDRSREQLYGA